MAVKFNMLIQILLVVSAIYNCEAQSFDIRKFGAKHGGDATKGILAAWKEACASKTKSEIVIPYGIFFASRLRLEGPCKAPIAIKLQGTLKAPSDVRKLINGEEWISVIHVDGFTLTGGGTLDGQGADTWAKKKAKKVSFVQPTSLGLDFLTNAVVKDITSKDAKMFHINVFKGNNVTLSRVTIVAPEMSPNTDGIHIGRSTNVRILGCRITTGDDCVSLGDGAQQVIVKEVSCGPGHGIAIGSLGKYKNEEPVRDVTVTKCSLTNTPAGLRIKTWKNSPVGEASNIHFEDIRVTNVTNPILIDQEYCPAQNCPRTDPPSRVKISKVTFKTISGTSATKDAVKLVCSKSFPCQDVVLQNINLTYRGPGGVVANSTCVNVKPRLGGIVSPSICKA